jgi:hypothetical protein
MKKMMHKIGLLLGMTFIVMSLQAQTPPHPGDGSGGGPGAGDPPVGAPLDGGLSLLIALGTAYGFSKIKRK